MIEDLEGATTEPSRRRHVAALSAVTAAVALVLFFALVTPRTPVATPQLAASPAPSPAATVVTFAATDAQWIWVPDALISAVRVNVGVPDDGMSTVCAAGIGSSPPVHLMVLDRTGQPMAAYTSGTTGRFIPLPQAYAGSGWRTVPCQASDVFAPRINRAR